MTGLRLIRPVCILLLSVALPAGFIAGQVNGQPKQPGVLLLTSNRLVEGLISQSAGGYVVDKKYGTLVIPFDLVRLRARSRSELFRKLKATLPNNSADTNVELARWCLTNQLYSECRAELRDALALEPQREDARRMLKRVEEILNPQEPAHLSETKGPPRTRDGMLAQEARSLAGLSPESARLFVIRIQPILMNTCGNASCHGRAAKNDFRLTHIHSGRGSHRVFAERNLAAVLKHVDLKNPENSPLLRLSRGTHGPRGQSVFHGPQGDEQFEALKRWVAGVSRDLSAPEHREPSISPAKISPLQSEPGIRQPVRTSAENRFSTNSIVEQILGVSLPTGPPELNAGRTSGSGMRTSQQPNSNTTLLIEKILKEERRDAFDPGEFNRLSQEKETGKP